MSHYEERLDRDLGAIRQQVESIGIMVRDAVEAAVKALVRHDEALAAETILGDGAINRATRECDRLCHTFVVRHLPSAGHLRFVSSTLRINVALERMGDYARTVAREAVVLSQPAPRETLAEVEALTRDAVRMLEQATEAFVGGNVDLARETMQLDDDLEATFQRLFDTLLVAGERDRQPVNDLFAFLGIIHSLERFGAQAKNICEETVFTVTGETKDPKVYRILFVDRHGTVRGPMASAYARKAFPGSGRYDAASWLPAEDIDQAVLDYLDTKGAHPPDIRPILLDPDRDALARYHVIVALDKGAREQIPEIPYHTVFVEWDLGEGDPEDEEGLSALYRTVAGHVSTLMDALRGSDAD